LLDRGFCQPDAEEVTALEVKKKKDELDAQIEKVKKEYEEKQKLKREKRKAKEKEKDKAKEKEAQSKDEEEDKQDEKAKEDKVCPHPQLRIDTLINNGTDQRALQVERTISDRAWPPHIPPQQVSH
jgi:hypothetical protein